MRNLKDYFLIGIKGMAMGAADAVPGVSGGTIAFIAGIYEELIETISNVNLNLFKTLFTKGFKSFWHQLNGNFILALLSGIIISFVTFMRIAKYLLEHQPIYIWSFFFGLIIASIFLVAKQITKWRFSTYLFLLIGAVLAFYITTLPALGSNNNAFFLVLAGAIAICAMILPGISGSFILVILGAYKSLSDAIHDWDFKKIALFVLGALIGLLSFSRVLKWFFKHYHNTTLAILTGFIFGSLNKVWPWKTTTLVMEQDTGRIIDFSEVSSLGTLNVYQQKIGNFDNYKIVLEQSVLPNTFTEANIQADAQLFAAILFAVLGFLTIYLLEHFGNKHKNASH